MKIKGIGTIRKEDAMSILTREGRKAVKTGLITTEELGQMYKLDQVEKSIKDWKVWRNFPTVLQMGSGRSERRTYTAAAWKTRRCIL